jgi:periplasmic protein TonB
MNPSPAIRLAALSVLTLVIAFAGATPARAATEQAVPVRMVAPVYPIDLKRDGVTGIVSVVFDVDEKGDVQDPKILKSSDPKFEQPALDAIAKWKFKPCRKDGVPVKTRMAIPLQFKLDS